MPHAPIHKIFLAIIKPQKHVTIRSGALEVNSWRELLWFSLLQFLPETGKRSYDTVVFAANCTYVDRVSFSVNDKQLNFDKARPALGVRGIQLLLKRILTMSWYVYFVFVRNSLTIMINFNGGNLVIYVCRWLLINLASVAIFSAHSSVLRFYVL